LSAVTISVFGKTDLGQSRDHNEDTFLVADLSTGKASLLPDVRDHELGPRGSLFVVADGMGGAAAGELASSMAVDVIYRHLSTTWAGDPEVSGARFAFRVREAVELANRELYAYAQEHPDVRGMGTTVTLAGVFGKELILAQIGDSRGYLVREGRAIQLTRDQSLTQRLVDAGELTEEEAERSERRNIILQALGPDARVRVDLSQQSLCRRDLLVMCSDGLSGSVKKDEIAEMATQYPELPAFCSALIDLANERGGPDNITVVAARFGGDGLPEPDGTAPVGYQNFAVDGLEPDTDEHLVPAEQTEPAAVAASPISQRLLLIGAIVIAVLAAALFLL
jgi:protein phosphatase